MTETPNQDSDSSSDSPPIPHESIAEAVTDPNAAQESVGMSDEPDSTTTETENDENEDSGDEDRFTWKDYFPYEEPYNNQINAIKRTMSVADDDGFAAVEAACGTGKTLIALSAGLDRVRDENSKYERVFCLTSVKQQLRAFEDDLKEINDNLPDEVDPISGLTLVGKADMCSWVETDNIESYDIYNRCDELRDPVKARISGLDENAKVKELEGMVNEKQVNASANPAQAHQSDDWMSPYEAEVDPEDFCAYYANYRLQKELDNKTLNLNGVMTPDKVMQQASENGVCPHAALGESLDRAEVVIGNYYHAFDPLTVEAFSNALIDDETFVVCDEAHMVVPRVRDLLSDSVSIRTFKRAIAEIEGDVLDADNKKAQQAMRDSFSRNGFRPDDIKKFKAFAETIVNWIETKAVDALDSNNRSWQRQRHMEMDEQVDFPLRDPQTPQKDDFTEWLEDTDQYDIAKSAETIGEAIADARREAAEEVGSYRCNETYTDTIGRLLSAWVENDHEQYFRLIEMQKRYEEEDRADLDWNKHYIPHLVMKNCIPSDPIAERLNEFGGGILMSATLAPLDVYEEIVGLKKLRDLKKRPVEKMVYGLNFPKQNRESMAVSSTKFTWKNRKSPNSDEGKSTRRQYAQMMLDVAETTPGNVLICMPSYSEAEWATDVLEGRWGGFEWNKNKEIKDEMTKKVLTDESSSDSETENLKADFFSGDGKILITSLRGTLTEGVDYSGDKLDACLVCGVPIRSIAGPYPKAIRAAYEAEFGNNGFEYAFSVPAVRKTRQAVGRVIRGNNDVGVRVMADKRYSDTGWGCVRKYLPNYEQDDFKPTGTNYLREGLERFWNEKK